jgi:hypothetical protein
MAQNQVYFVLYGELTFKVRVDDCEPVNFGEVCGLGWTIGEEILFLRD